MVINISWSVEEESIMKDLNAAHKQMAEVVVASSTKRE